PPGFRGFESMNTASSYNESTTYMDTGSAITSSLSATSYSMEIWYNDSFDGALHYIGGRYAGGGSYFGDSLLVFGALYFFDGSRLFGGVGTAPFAWHQAVLTRNNTNVNVYVDGTLAFSANSTAAYATSKEFIVGTRGDFAGNTFFKGDLDELSVY